MYFLVLEVHPKPDHDEYGIVDGAFASCFADAASASDAEDLAREFLADVGWDTEQIDEAPRWIDRAELDGNAESLERYDQAGTDKIVVTLHKWPVGASDDE
jgi:hypothetical protein